MKRGFTLIELLVVVAIIVSLLAILMPALGRAQRTASLAVCASNLHQVGTAHGAYASDHFGQFTMVGYWTGFQQMLYMKYDGPSYTNPARGFMNLGLLEKTGFVDPHSDVTFCPLQTNSGLLNSLGDLNHANAIPNNLPQGMLPEDTAKFGWANKRAGYLRRDLRGGGQAPTATYAERITDVGRLAFFADVFSTPATVITSHGDSVNVLYGDGAVMLKPIDAEAGPLAAIVTYSPTNGAVFDKMWEQFDRR